MSITADEAFKNIRTYTDKNPDRVWTRQALVDAVRSGGHVPIPRPATAIARIDQLVADGRLVSLHTSYGSISVDDPGLPELHLDHGNLRDHDRPKSAVLTTNWQKQPGNGIEGTVYMTREAYDGMLDRFRALKPELDAAKTKARQEQNAVKRAAFEAIDPDYLAVLRALRKAVPGLDIQTSHTNMTSGTEPTTSLIISAFSFRDAIAPLLEILRQGLQNTEEN